MNRAFGEGLISGALCNVILEGQFALQKPSLVFLQVGQHHWHSVVPPSQAS